jgi:hypothetical protein
MRSILSTRYPLNVDPLWLSPSLDCPPQRSCIITGSVTEVASRIYSQSIEPAPYLLARYHPPTSSHTAMISLVHLLVRAGSLGEESSRLPIWQASAHKYSTYISFPRSFENSRVPQMFSGWLPTRRADRNHCDRMKCLLRNY